jgi:hypothetical protein
LPRSSRAQLVSVVRSSWLLGAGVAAAAAAAPLQGARAEELPSYCPALREITALVQAEDRFKRGQFPRYHPPTARLVGLFVLR